MKKLLSLLALSTILFTTQCKKNSDVPPPDNPYGLPNATESGAYIFACRINRQNWICPLSYNLGGKISQDTLGCYASIFTTNYFETIIINLKGILIQVGKYDLSDTTKSVMRFGTDTTCLGNSARSVLDIRSISGSLTITKIDIPNKIMSGTFNCRIPIPQCDTLNITDGRFDVPILN